MEDRGHWRQGKKCKAADALRSPYVIFPDTAPAPSENRSIDAGPVPANLFPFRVIPSLFLSHAPHSQALEHLRACSSHLGRAVQRIEAAFALSLSQVLQGMTE